ncbi:DNA polymerase alpha/epsilon subunit B-domain-containing protein [Xylaria nigripes]|nr:DNA polymerase alpha/epsilon subunit B-domain-containing protein [Xylaria nigripes]
MAELNEIRGNMLRRPTGAAEDEIERAASDYYSFDSFTLRRDRSYQQQFADMYFLRLTKIKPALEQRALEAWSEIKIGDEHVRRAERVLDIRQGELCWVIGTVYMDMVLKPNILDDVSKDRWLSAPLSTNKYYSEDGSDAVTLEDESGRICLVGDFISDILLVTGCIIAVMGTENVHGQLEVIDLKFPDLPPQIERWAVSKPSTPDETEKSVKSEDDDVEMADIQAQEGGRKIAIVSGLEFSSRDAKHAIELQLLLEYLLGETLDPTAQRELSQITHLIIAGNSIMLKPPAEKAGKKKTEKKYGYDSSLYNPVPSRLLDEFLSTILPTIPVTLLPGAQDPANTSYPQQPIHRAMFPLSRAFMATPGSDETNWFDPVTNPWEGEIDGWRVLGTGGQNVDDIFKYVGSDDRVGMMEAMCRWQCCAPTAPDTLWSYPFQDNDPFVMQTCPHLFIVGNQPAFGTRVIEGEDGQVVRLIAVPYFSATREIVLVDCDTLNVSLVKISAG